MRSRGKLSDKIQKRVDEPGAVSRWVILRDLFLFQLKLFLDGLIDVTLSPLSIAVAAVEILFGGERRGEITRPDRDRQSTVRGGEPDSGYVGLSVPRRGTTGETNCDQREWDSLHHGAPPTWVAVASVGTDESGGSAAGCRFSRLLNLGHHDLFRIQLARDLRHSHRSLHLIAGMICMIAGMIRMIAT